MRSKITAGFLAIFLGSLGIHKFYLGRPVQGAFYLGFSWTGIPTLLGLGEGLYYFLMADWEFNKEYNPLLDLYPLPRLL